MQPLCEVGIGIKSCHKENVDALFTTRDDKEEALPTAEVLPQHRPYCADKHDSEVQRNKQPGVSGHLWEPRRIFVCLGETEFGQKRFLIWLAPANNKTRPEEMRQIA